MRKTSGFTIVELIVASVVMSIALLGVHSVFRQGVDVERRVSHQLQNRQTAGAIADFFARSLENCVNFADQPSLVAGPDADGGIFLQWASCNAGYGNTQAGSNGIIFRSVRWKPATSDTSGILESRSLIYAGAKNITPGDQFSGENPWLYQPVQILAKDVEKVSLQFVPLSEPSASWKENWQGGVGEVGIRIQITLQGCTEERIVIPKVTGWIGG